jgi:hypothetical protein
MSMNLSLVSPTIFSGPFFNNGFSLLKLNYYLDFLLEIDISRFSMKKLVTNFRHPRCLWRNKQLKYDSS